MPSLALISNEITRLFDVRDTLLDAEEVDVKSVSIIDDQIRQWVEAEARKVDGCALMLRSQESAIEAHKLEIARLKKHLERIEDSRTMLENMIMCVMAERDTTTLKGDLREFRVIKNPPKVEIVQEEMVPEEYKRTKTVEEWNKMRIKADLQAGKGVPGCHLSEGFRLEIR